MTFIAITLNHMRSVKAWADSCDASVNLDLRTFNLEVKARNRYYILKPRFLVDDKGKLAYSTRLVKEVTGFIGWLPYDVLQWKLSMDKLLFKAFLEKAGLRSPATWKSEAEVNHPFLVKQSAGSFGYRIGGPYRNAGEGKPLEEAGGVKPAVGTDFAEQFVVGTNLKVWFWGEKAIYAHVHPYPTLVGDGVSTVQSLLDARFRRLGRQAGEQADTANIISSLAFQQVRLSDILKAGQEVWFDFRYGRMYAPASSTTESDSDLDKINPAVMTQINAIGVKLAEECLSRFKAPVLYSVDAVVDDAGDVWWLEVNSNPVLPPDGYPMVFRSLFGALDGKAK
jgi:hypothetical protein